VAAGCSRQEFVRDGRGQLQRSHAGENAEVLVELYIHMYY
jgi:hypothetical protein